MLTKKVSLDNVVMNEVYQDVILPEFKNALQVDVYVQMLDYIRLNLETSNGEKDLNKILAHELKKIISGLTTVQDNMVTNMGVAIVSLGSQDFINKFNVNK